MPRDGLSQYAPPPGTNGITNYTIESTKYNGFVADVTQDLNLPRPIVAGGTGATSATQALFNLSGETATQAVTSWDSQLWRPGSFYAASTATGIAPVSGHAFAGVCYLNEPLTNPPTNQNLVTEATDLTDPLNPDKYIRVMTAGVWGSWIRQGASAAANLGDYVFDGTITFPPLAGQVRLNNATENSATEIFISHLGALGGDNTGVISFFLKTGSDVIIQDKDEGPKYKIYTTTADPVLSGGDFRVTAIFKSGGTDVVSGQRVMVGASTGGTVLYNVAQTLAPAQQVQARQNIYAAPLDAMSCNGMQVNGSFDVSQEIGTAGVIGSGRYFCDGWVVFSNGTQVVGGFQVAAGIAAGFSNSGVLSVNTASTSLAIGDYVAMAQYIEGRRIARLAWGGANAQPITLCFWSSHNRPGLYSGTIRNSSTRSYAFTYTQAAANVPQFNTVTVPGDTTGSWASDNTVGMIITFAMATGATFTAPSANAWVNGNYHAAPGQINGVAATSDVLRITGVVVLPGGEAPSAARSSLIMRPYGQELLTCKRYYEKTYPYANPPGTNGVGGGECRIIPSSSITAGMFYGGVRFPVGKRATPTVTIYGYAGAVGQVSNMGGVDLGANTAVQYGNTENSFTLGSNAAATTGGNAITFHWVADARL
jgi:hypothetical protein